jgi:hypothetical protein
VFLAAKAAEVRSQTGHANRDSSLFLQPRTDFLRTVPSMECASTSGQSARIWAALVVGFSPRCAARRVRTRPIQFSTIWDLRALANRASTYNGPETVFWTENLKYFLESVLGGPTFSTGQPGGIHPRITPSPTISFRWTKGGSLSRNYCKQYPCSGLRQIATFAKKHDVLRQPDKPTYARGPKKHR